MRWPRHASIYEVNTWVWLGELARRAGRPVDLGHVPGAAWDAVCLPGVNAVWLMGVWTRSPVAAAAFRDDPDAVARHRALLPDYEDRDVVGSAYAVRDYTVDPHLGGDAGLAVARAELARRGCALVLDYVPNHTAPDHRWVFAHPDRYVQGTAGELATEPAAYLEVDDEGDVIVARGRDPYFAPWPDVAQLDLFAPAARVAAIETMRAIGDRADAVRCDMAMLAVTDVFARTWTGRLRTRPSGEFWEEVIGEVRTTHPDLVLLAEAYWGTEATLVSHGFDACYDKELYDHLVTGSAGAVRGRVEREHANRSPWVRFIENHDEPRAATAFLEGADRAAAVAIATLPGTTLWHEGQFDGRRHHVPVMLARRPPEPPDADRRAFYQRLLPAAAAVRRGAWQPAPTSGWDDNRSHEQLMAWCWSAPTSRSLVVVNLAATSAQARVHPPWPDLHGPLTLTDLLSGDRYSRDGGEIATNGLYVDLPPWGTHVLSAGSTVLTAGRAPA
jgi:hypothetical protein